MCPPARRQTGRKTKCQICRYCCKGLWVDKVVCLLTYLIVWHTNQVPMIMAGCHADCRWFMCLCPGLVVPSGLPIQGSRWWKMRHPAAAPLATDLAVHWNRNHHMAWNFQFGEICIVSWYGKLDITLVDVMVSLQSVDLSALFPPNRGSGKPYYYVVDASDPAVEKCQLDKFDGSKGLLCLNCRGNKGPCILSWLPPISMCSLINWIL